MAAVSTATTAVVVIVLVLCIRVAVLPLIRRLVHHWQWKRHVQQYPYAVLVVSSPLTTTTTASSNTPRSKRNTTNVSAAAAATTVARVLLERTLTVVFTGIGLLWNSANHLWTLGTQFVAAGAARLWKAVLVGVVVTNEDADVDRRFVLRYDDDEASTAVAVNGTSVVAVMVEDTNNNNVTTAVPLLGPKTSQQQQQRPASVLKTRSSLDGTTTTNTTMTTPTATTRRRLLRKQQYDDGPWPFPRMKRDVSKRHSITTIRHNNHTQVVFFRSRPPVRGHDNDNLPLVWTTTTTVRRCRVCPRHCQTA
jgi:hypothetical protein